MKKSVCLIVAGMVMLGLIGIASAGQRDDAKALVKKAVAYLKDNGKEKAIAEFNNPQGKFVKGGLYILMADSKGNALAHGANAKLVGKNMYDLRDPDGIFITRELINVAKKGGGWSAKYRWTNPVTKKLEPKISYVEPFEDLNVACGIYE